MNSTHASRGRRLAPSTRRLPSLSMLRAFEAAGRLGSVTRAADELNVTQSAVSHQLKQLEQWLDVKLVTRQGRNLALTEKGAAYLPSLEQAFDLMSEATALVAQVPSRPRLTVNALPTVAAQWLIPKLPAFCAEMPSVDVQILTTASSLDFDPGDFDVSVRCMSDAEYEKAKQRRGWQDVRVSRFLPESPTPLCSQAYANAMKLSAEPSSLYGCKLIHSHSTPGLWERWFKSAGMTNRRFPGALVFDHTHQAVQAAVQGLGVALGSVEMNTEAIEAGLLVAPFPDLRLADKHYCWIAAPSAMQRSVVEDFCSWLDAQGGLARQARTRRTTAKPVKK